MILPVRKVRGSAGKMHAESKPFMLVLIDISSIENLTFYLQCIDYVEHQDEDCLSER